MADITVEAVSQAVKAAPFLKLLFSLAQNLPVQPNQDISLPQDQNKVLYLKFEELKNELADLRRDNLKLKAEICRLSSETKSLHAITESQEEQLEGVKTDMAALQTELVQTQTDFSAQTEELNSLRSRETRTKAEVRSALRDISELREKQEMDKEDWIREMDWIVDQISEFEGARHFSPKHPESQTEHPRSFDSAGREPLLCSFENRKRYQGSDNVRARSGLSPSADPFSNYEVASNSHNTVLSQPKSPSMPPPSNHLSLLKELACDIEVFNPETPGNSIELYLKDVHFALSYLPDITMSDKLFILRTTTTQAVHSFIDRQSPAISNDFNELCKALAAEFTLHENPYTSRLSAFKIKQGRHESPREYYERLREMYFAGKDYPDAKEDPLFKHLFVANLYPTVRKQLALFNIEKTWASELRQLAIRAWDSGKVNADRKNKEYAYISEPGQDRKNKKFPAHLDVVSEPDQNRIPSKYKFFPQSKSFDKNAKKPSAGEKRQHKDRRESRQKRKRDDPGNNWNMGNGIRQSRGFESRHDDDLLSKMHNMLQEHLKSLNSEEHCSTDRDQVTSA